MYNDEKIKNIIFWIFTKIASNKLKINFINIFYIEKKVFKNLIIVSKKS